MDKLTLLFLLLLASCSGTIGGEAGKCVGAQVMPPSVSVNITPPPAPTGEFAFSAPAGSRFALCAW